MSVVTQEMILEYMRRKGGRVKNVDLVKHFRKHLSFEDKTKKEQAREMFKETVNSVAVIRQEEGEKFLYLRDENISNNHHPQPNHTSSPPRTPIQPVVQQSPNRVQPQPHPPTTSPQSRVTSTQQQQQRNVLSSNQGRPTDLSSNQGRPTDLSSNLGRPTDLSNGRHSLVGTPSPQPPVSPTRVARPGSSVPYQYQNGTSDFTKPEEKSFIPKQKSPVPPPKPTDRSSPRGTSPSPHSQTPNRGVSPPHQSPNKGVPPSHQSAQRSISPNPSTGRVQEKPLSNSPRILSPPRSHSSSPRAMPSPRHNGTANATPLGSTPTRSYNRHHPEPSSSFTPVTQSPSRHARQPPPPPSSQQPRLVTQSTVPSLPVSHSHFTASGRGNSNAKKRLEISGPMSVTSLSNGPSGPTSAQFIPGGLNQSIPHGSPSHSGFHGATPISQSLDDKYLSSSMLEHYTSELENIGGSSPFATPHSLINVGPLENQSHRDVPVATTSSFIGSSENSSLSSTSAHSTHSPPPVDVSSAPNHPRIGHKISQTGSVGVQKLIQQYTVPPGAVVPVSPPTDPVLLSPTRSSQVGRSSSSVSNQSTGSNVVFRRQETPPDGSKVQRSQSNAASIQHRRSRLTERNSNLDTLTRQSIKGIHKLHRQSMTSDELIPASSREELLSNEDHDRADSPVNEREEEFTYEIDPMEREWVQALINTDMDEIHRILMTDNTIIDKRSFLHGWSGLHWAVKSSNEEIIRVLIMSGAKIDIRSGGLTPLHIAAECGNEKVIKMLVYEYNASTNVRDHSGRRPVDVLHPFALETMRTTLRNGLDDVPVFRNQSLAIAMGSVKPSGMGPTANAFHIPRTGTQSAATLRRNWNSTGHLIDSQVPDKGTLRRSQLSPRVARKGFSFRRKKQYQVNINNKRDSGQAEYYHERKDS